MEIIYIGIVIILVWLGRTLHNIRGRDQEEANKKIAFAMCEKEQRDPHLVSMVQNLMSEGDVLRPWKKRRSMPSRPSTHRLRRPAPVATPTTRKERLQDLPEGELGVRHDY